MIAVRYLIFIPIFLVLGIPAFAANLDPTLLLGYNAGVNDNQHNLSNLATHGGPKANLTGGQDETRICVFCHTPHGATAQTPLWNRKDPKRMGTFPLYNSATLNISDPGIVATTQYQTNPAGSEYPNGATKLCLSCHDGATALGELGNGINLSMNQATITNPVMAFDPLNPGTNDFSKTHPVSFVYSATVAAYINANGKSGYTLPADPDVRLDSRQRIQCTTCHNPHLDTRLGGYFLPFWANYKNPADPTLDYDNTCAECHTDQSSATVPPTDGHNL